MTCSRPRRGESCSTHWFVDRRTVGSTRERSPTCSPAYRIPYAATEEVDNVEAARRAAERLGYPVALQAAGEGVLHKTEIGGVALGLRSPDELQRAWSAMAQRVGAVMTGGLVQSMVPAGVETIAGILRDPTFGPLVMFGMGGTAAELLQDRAVRIAPVAGVDAAEAVHSLRGAPLLTGYRGATPVDVAAVEDLVVRLGLLARDVPEIVELDLNPVIASPSGIVAVDARIRVAGPAAGTAMGARHLPRPAPDQCWVETGAMAPVSPRSWTQA